MNKDAELLQQLVKILSNHCGETGENEGAVQTLNRIIEDYEQWNIYQLTCKAMEITGIQELNKAFIKQSEIVELSKTELEAFKAVVNQANENPELWDFRALTNESIGRFEKIMEGKE